MTMKPFNHTLLILLLPSTAHSFTPPNFSRPLSLLPATQSSDSLTTQPNKTKRTNRKSKPQTRSNTKSRQAKLKQPKPKETPLEKSIRHKQSKRIWGQTKMTFRARPDTDRPYNELSLEELGMLTDYRLGLEVDREDGAVSSATDNGKSEHDECAAGETGGGATDGVDENYNQDEITSHQIHELTKLISSWAKLASLGYISTKDGPLMLTKKEKVMAAEMAEKCLKYIVERSDGRGVVFEDLYFLVVTAWIKTETHSNLTHATTLLTYMENNNLSINNPHSFTKVYATILEAWTKSPYVDSAYQSETILHKMTSLEIATVKHYNLVINRYATDAKRDSGVQAERLLNELIASYHQGGVAPNRYTFNSVIKAYVNSGKNGAKRIFNMMEHPSNYGLEGIASEIEPDKVSCTLIITSLGNSDEYGNCDVDAGVKAEELLRRMENSDDEGMKPDTAVYNAVIKVWGKCNHPQSAQKSEQLLNQMLTQYEQSTNPSAKPNDVTFNSVIHNLAISPDLDSPSRAQNILDKMQYCFDAGIIDVKPDIVTYNSVLNSFAKSKVVGSAERAEEMLDGLERKADLGGWSVQPDVYSYNTVINAWSNSNEEDGAQRAVALLDRMSTRATANKSNIQPDITTYNSVLHAWSQSPDRNAPIKALGLLELMFRYYEKGDENAKPDVLSFSTVINAFSKSKFPGKARECRNLMRRMKSLYDEGDESMQPNIFVYSAVLNACAYTFGREDEKADALNIGIETFEELKSSDVRPNHVAYGSFLRMCRRLMAEDDSRRAHFITRAFKQCCADGQVGIYVLKQVRADPKMYVALLNAYIVDGEVEYDDLPAEWTRNVKERRRTSDTNKKGHQMMIK